MLKMSSFSEQVGLQILLLESFDYFGTREYFSGKKRTILMSKTLWLGVVNFHRMQMSLVMSMQFIFGDD